VDQSPAVMIDSQARPLLSVSTRKAPGSGGAGRAPAASRSWPPRCRFPIMSERSG